LIFQDVLWIDICIRILVLTWLSWQDVPWFGLQVLGMCSHESLVVIRVVVIGIQSDPVIKLLSIDALRITDRFDAAALPDAFSNADVTDIL
jgi:hypothetical protein